MPRKKLRDALLVLQLWKFRRRRGFVFFINTIELKVPVYILIKLYFVLQDFKRKKMGIAQQAKGTPNVSKPFLEARIPKANPLQKKIVQNENVIKDNSDNSSVNDELNRLKAQLQEMQEESRKHKEEARLAKEKLRQQEDGEESIKTILAAEMIKIHQTLSRTLEEAIDERLSRKVEQKLEEMKTALITEMKANQNDSVCKYEIRKMGYVVDWVNAISVEY